ncbi:hypothetical protein LSAT2_008028 [Lamellibrachia satsuma]|nr:hypothetical protein LSAT2_008028 [Lamellibrachia satsuma]
MVDLQREVLLHAVVITNIRAACMIDVHFRVINGSGCHEGWCYRIKRTLMARKQTNLRYSSSCATHKYFSLVKITHSSTTIAS